MTRFSGPLILTGMHRSGTSLLSRYLSESGVNMGPELLGPARGNPHGHFEDTGILAFHREILIRKYKDQMWVPRAPRIDARDIARARDLIAQRSQNSPWGWKEPRTSLFLPLWNEVCPDSRILVIVRDPWQVADSLLRRSLITNPVKHQVSKFLLQWRLYNSECLRFATRFPSRCLIVMLAEVLESPGWFSQLLCEFTGWELQPDLFTKLFVAEELNTKDLDKTLSGSLLETWRTERLFARLASFAAHPNTTPH